MVAGHSSSPCYEPLFGYHLESFPPDLVPELRRKRRQVAVEAGRQRDEGGDPVLGELHGEVVVFQPMAIREISRSGAQVETSFPLQLDSLHELRLSLGNRSVILKARVVQCSICDVDQELVTYRSGTM